MKTTNGQALLVTMLVLALAAVLSSAVWSLLAVEIAVSQSQNQALKAVYIAESGLERARYYLANEETDWTVVEAEPDILQDKDCGEGEFSAAFSDQSQYHITVVSTGVMGQFPQVSRSITTEANK